TVAPNFCGGSVMFSASNSPSSGGGATFTADLQATQTNSINIRFHFRDPAAKGKPNTDCSSPAENTGDAATCGASWSSTQSFTPDVVSTPVPVGAVGGLLVTAIVCVGFFLFSRSRRRSVTAP